MVAVLPNLIEMMKPSDSDDNKTPPPSLPPAPPVCTFKHFNTCGPVKFSGTEGATGLLQWYESIENTFTNNNCPNHLQKQYATSVFQKGALTWWSTVKRSRGPEIALALPWEEFKALMTKKFCPRSEYKKLEVEFWELKQDSGEGLAYTNRFHWQRKGN